MPRAAHCRAGGTLLLLARNQDLPRFPGSRSSGSVSFSHVCSREKTKRPSPLQTQTGRDR